MRASEKRHWDEYWAASSELGDVYGTDDRIIRNLEKHVELSHLKVLEVGAGTGRDTDKLAARCGYACALDYSEESLKLMSSSLHNPVAVVCGDALNLPFADGSFDVVFHQGLLEHFRNPGDLLDENVRVLKEGGILLVDVPQRYHYYTVLKHILIAIGKWFAGWETEFSVKQLNRLLEARGLEIVDVYGHNMSPPIWYRGMRRILLAFNVRLPMYPRAPAIVSGPFAALKSLVPQRLFLNTAMVIGSIARKK